MSFPLNIGVVHIIGSVLLLAVARTVYQVLREPTAHVPGPWYSNWTRLVLDFHFLSGTAPGYVHALHQKVAGRPFAVGPVVRIGPNEVDFTDVTAVKAIYGVKESFRKSQFYRRVTAPGQESLFTTINVDFHRRRRRLLAGPMSESSLKSLIPTVNGRVELAVDKISAEMKALGYADVCKWWLFMTTDTIGELTFGDSFRMLELGRKNDYAHELEQIGLMAAIRSTFPTLVRLSHAMPFLPVVARTVEASRNMSRYASESLERYRGLVAASPDLVQQTLFTKVFQAEDEDKLTFDEIRNEAQSYIVAGSDTTANSLTYLTWSVCRNPGIRDALVKELRTLPEAYTESQLRDLPFLNLVIDEALRLYPAAPFVLPRSVPPGGAELAGYWLKEGDVVSAQTYSMHRDPVIFPDPDEFVPSRWANPTQLMKDAYMPFGRGPRVCIGQHLAGIELRLATARFFLAFPEARVSSHEGMSDEDMKPKMYFLLAPSGGRCLIQPA
ncbi:putative sterigmatocystin biosynthesis P450 monooxygenase [Tolypocladium ophioglossoides CBS 100239]|uniref:Putative sterigmatocystin biosynthesis P450 monooxygenase n=1 Tax=Tolypocladium ophioglossoides (strain CBS 100239) TaxID=1163406 RepID=A0A0L0N5E0_TOLOC|nr:putative sterigmatocystin biosynthesis P450 monooxygenase [Tolypocladium ophioglossoides CBS 100239]